MHKSGMVTAEEVKKTRAALGESQDTFGERFGVDQSTIHRWETETPPSRGLVPKALRELVDDVAKRNAQAPQQAAE